MSPFAAIRGLFSRDLPVQITIANLAAMALSLAAVPIIARGVGPAGRGETGAAVAAFTLVPVLLAAGMPLEIRRRSVVGDAGASIRAARDIAVTSFLPALLVGFLVMHYVFGSAPGSVQYLVLAGIALAPLGVVWSTDTGALVGSGRYRAVAIVRIVQPLFTLVTIGLLWLFGLLTREWVLIPYVLGSVMTMVVSTCLVRVGLLGERASRRALVRQGARFAGSAVAEAASARLDQVLVLPIIGASAAGLYSIATAAVALLTALGQAIGADFFRQAARARSDNESRSIAAVGMSEGISVILPSALGLGAVSLWAFPVLLGEEYAGSVALLWWLLPGGVSVAVGYVGSMLLAGAGRGKAMTLLQVGTLVLGFALLYALGPTMGAAGAAIASSISGMGLLISQLVVLGLRPHAVLPRWGSVKGGTSRLFAR